VTPAVSGMWKLRWVLAIAEWLLYDAMGRLAAPIRRLRKKVR